jgi:FtsP/CotA-like multicopper oxidase with cupredoxin domain
MAMTTPRVPEPPLPMFQDRLRIPPVLHPGPQGTDAPALLRVRMLARRVRLHSHLPPTSVWTYDGLLPGPTIEVRRGQRLRMEWVNALPARGPYPVIAITAPDSLPDSPPERIPQNQPGRSCGHVNDVVTTLPPWTVVHLHGGRTAAASDGWTENGYLHGQTMVADYDNDQRATMLWYHDHALGITRFNVYAGLAGLWVIRDDEEDRLGLPSGPYEIPLLIQDRNLDTGADGALSGRLLHKVEEGTMEFFGPFALVNGTIWPYVSVEPRSYRLRLLNGSNARTYRLLFLDEKGHVVSGLVKQIGTEGGLLAQPVDLPPDGLVLAPAERADLIVDFRPMRGARVRLVNSAGAPFNGTLATHPPGEADPANRLPYPEVMEFRVAARGAGDPFVPPRRLSTIRRLPPVQVERIAALVEEDGMLTLHELADVPGGEERPGEPLITVTDDKGMTRRYRTMAVHFEDTTNWMVAYGTTEAWRFLNLTEDTHPMHVHLVHFQVLARDRYDTSGFDPTTGATRHHVTFQGRGVIDANERGWKETVRVNPGEMVTIGATFDGYTGRYMYHCHILEHEDMDMMRPFVVAPAAALSAMRM